MVDFKKLKNQGLLDTSHLKSFIEQEKIPIISRALDETAVVKTHIAGIEHTIALPVTFTPYASTAPCSARCWFCSENLQKNKNLGNGAKLRPAGLEALKVKLAKF